jgi:hypothetical protein
VHLGKQRVTLTSQAVSNAAVTLTAPGTNMPELVSNSMHITLFLSQHQHCCSPESVKLDTHDTCHFLRAVGWQAAHGHKLCSPTCRLYLEVAWDCIPAAAWRPHLACLICIECQTARKGAFNRWQGKTCFCLISHL